MDKIHYLIKKEDKNIFEDINLQYIEPLEGEDEESEKDDISYNKYLKGVNKELNTKKEEITFVNDIGLNSNLLNTKEIFDKIKRQNKYKNLKTQNSFRSSISKTLIKNKIGIPVSNLVDIEENENIKIDNEEEIKKDKNKGNSIYLIRKRKKDLSMINKLLLSKFEIKKFINNEKRFMTYNNINNFSNYLNEKDLVLNIKEKKNNKRKLNSGKINKYFLNRPKKKENINSFEGKNYKKIIDQDEDIFGNKRKTIIVEPYYYLDDEPYSELSEKEGKEKEINKKKIKGKKSKTTIIKSKKDEGKEKEKEKEEEKKMEGNVHPLVQLEENIKKINMKTKKKKKEVVPKENIKKETKEKTNLFVLKKSNNFINIKYKDINSVNGPENNIISSRLKSPAINSILNDIKSLSNKVMKTNKIKKSRSKKNLYEKHFGYEYWKENEFRKTFFHPMSTNKKIPSAIGSMNSTLLPDDSYSMISSNLNYALKNNDYYINDEYSNFLFKINDNSFNPYSVHWTKNMLKNYNRKIKLKKRISGIPKIELKTRSRSSVSMQPTINYNLRNVVDSKNSNFYRKNNNMFGRIYNKNEVEFPFIYKS